MQPKLAMINLFEEPEELRSFAGEQGFQGIEWSFRLDRIPETPAAQSGWVRRIQRLQPLEVRFHCPFYRIDLGHDDPERLRQTRDVVLRCLDDLRPGRSRETGAS